MLEKIHQTIKWLHEGLTGQVSFLASIDRKTRMKLKPELKGWFEETTGMGCPYSLRNVVRVDSEVYFHEQWQEWCVVVYQKSKEFGAGGGPIPVRFLIPTPGTIKGYWSK